MKNSFLDINNINLTPSKKTDPEVKKSSVNKRDIAIIGVSGRIASTENIDEFWKLIINKTGVYDECEDQRKEDYISFLEAMGMKTKKENISFAKSACMKDVDKFDYDFFGINPLEAELMDPSQRIMLQTVYNALEDAGYGEKNIYGRKIGMYIGYSQSTKSYVELFRDSPDVDYGKALTGNLPSVISSRLSYLMNLNGPALLIDTACSSGLTALHTAINALRANDCEMAVVGSVNYEFEPYHETDVKVGTESSDGKVKAFDDFSDGTSSGEASVAVIVKQLYKAIEDNDNIYAVIKGSALNQDGVSVGITAPNMDAQEKMLVKAWDDAGINPETISYIETHGTGTNLGDPIEINAIKNAFEKYTDKKQFCAVTSVKTNVGHTNSAAGMVGLIKAVLSIKNHKIPATINFNVPNRNIDFIDSPVYVNTETMDWNADTLRCGVSSFGLSGTNAHIILEEYKGENKKASVNEENHILTVSAKSRNALKLLLERYADFISSNDISLDDFCYTINSSRKTHEYRVCFVFNDRSDLIKKISDTADKIDKVIKVKMLNSSVESDDIINMYNSGSAKNTELLNKLADLFQRGAEINWENFYQDSQFCRISAPVYPFDKKRCWYDVNKNQLFRRCFDKYCQGMMDDVQLPDTLRTALSVFNEEYSRYMASQSKLTDNSAVHLIGRENGIYTDTEKFLAQMCYETFGYIEIDVNATLEDMNADSLQIITYYGKIRNKYEVNVTDIYNHPTVSMLAEHLVHNQMDIDDFIAKFCATLNQMMESNEKFENSKEFADASQRYKRLCAQDEKKDLSISNNYRNILLTGATGYLGAHLLKEILEHSDSVVYTIERSKSGSSQSRVPKNFESFFGTGSYEKYSDRVRTVFGDLESENMGMNESDYTDLSEVIDCVIHSAANTNHVGEYSVFYKSNVEASENVISFAKKGRKKDIHYVSTMNVIEYIKSSQNIFFTEFDEVSLDDVENIENYYARTKIIAENTMCKAREDGINVNIYRFGRIMFEYETGVMQNNIQQNASCLMIRSFLKLGKVPDVSFYEMDCTFVDIAARGMTAIIFAKEMNNSTFHFQNPKMLRLNEILTNEKTMGHAELVTLDEFLDEFSKSYKEDRPDKEYFRDILIHAFNDGNVENGIGQCIHEEVERTANIMKRLGVEWEKVTPEVFNRFIMHCRNKKFLD